MQIDEFIAKLPDVALKNKDLLPTDPGIYYVVDETGLIWYIGQAKNLQKRWSGNTHHRIDQLIAKNRQKNFRIHYECVSANSLNEVENSRINKYNPHLNGSKVKTKNVIPTETLLRETLTAIADVAFILGIEPPRKDDPVYLQKFNNSQGKDWFAHKKIMSLSIVHICLDMDTIDEMMQKNNYEVNGYGYAQIGYALRQIFNSKKNYANHWCVSSGEDFVAPRLLVNGYLIEVYRVSNEFTSLIKGYELTSLAEIPFRKIDENSLTEIHTKCYQHKGEVKVFKTGLPSSEYEKEKNQAIQRIALYTENPIRIVFNEPIITKTFRELLEISKNDYEQGKRGIGSRSQPKDISDLLKQRNVDLQKYNNSSYFVRVSSNKRINIFVRSFITNLCQVTDKTDHGLTIFGSKGHCNQINCIYEKVYILTSVEREGWILFEQYLSDFAKVRLADDEGCIEKVHVSPRKIIAPAKMTIKLEGIGNFTIPFGLANPNMKYEEAKEIIKKRLTESGIGPLKITFSSEKIVKATSGIQYIPTKLMDLSQLGELEW